MILSSVLILGLSSSTSDVGRAGPFVEYERRIFAGELVDGDSCQVSLISKLCIFVLNCLEREREKNFYKKKKKRQDYSTI